MAAKSRPRKQPTSLYYALRWIAESVIVSLVFGAILMGGTPFGVSLIASFIASVLVGVLLFYEVGNYVNAMLDYDRSVTVPAPSER